MGRNKSKTKDQRKRKRERKRRRDRQNSAIDERNRQQLDPNLDVNQRLAVDAPHRGFSPDQFQSSAAEIEAAMALDDDPEMGEWWKEYLAASGSQRIEMVRAAANGNLDEYSMESLFPTAIMEIEGATSRQQYVEFLESLADEHPHLYQTGPGWFLRSRLLHYFFSRDYEKVEPAVIQSAKAITEIDETFFGIVAMLHLAEFESAAEQWVQAGHRCMDAESLLPWVVAEIINLRALQSIRQCVRKGGTDAAIEAFEREIAQRESVSLEELGIDQQGALQRRQAAIRVLAGLSTTSWQLDQLIGDSDQAMENRFLLRHEFMVWLGSQYSIGFTAAHELGAMVDSTLRDRELGMESFVDGISASKLAEFLGELIEGFHINMFKIRGSLIAIDLFATFLDERKLTHSNALKRTRSAVKLFESELPPLSDPDVISDSCLIPLVDKLGRIENAPAT